MTLHIAKPLLVLLSVIANPDLSFRPVWVFSSSQVPWMPEGRKGDTQGFESLNRAALFTAELS